MTRVKVLIKGIHEEIEGIMHASSTVSLIQSQDKNILVDSGSFGDRKKLIEALKKESLEPKDIDILIVTHAHLDHTANLDLFKNAEIYAKHSPSSKGSIFHGNSNEIIGKGVDLENHKITDDVLTILTPGHLESHISVVVNTHEGVYVICGDAISKEEYTHGIHKPRRAWNWEEYEKSRKRILEIADFIIPGHGEVFKVQK